MPKDLQKSVDDLFQDANVPKSNFWKPTTPGDKAAGYLVDRKKKPNTLKPGTDQWIYTLMNKDGSVINVAGRYGSPQTLQGFDTAKLGQLVGIKYIEDKPATKAGFNPLKVMKTYVSQDFAPELVEQYSGASLGDTSGEGIPY